MIFISYLFQSQLKWIALIIQYSRSAYRQAYSVFYAIGFHCIAEGYAIRLLVPITLCKYQPLSNYSLLLTPNKDC
jgi:hypothetical protein